MLSMAILFPPFRGAALTEEQQEFNRQMSSVRVSVEWMFGAIVRQWAFIDFKKSIKVSQLKTKKEKEKEKETRKKKKEEKKKIVTKKKKP